MGLSLALLDSLDLPFPAVLTRIYTSDENNTPVWMGEMFFKSSQQHQYPTRERSGKEEGKADREWRTSHYDYRNSRCTIHSSLLFPCDSADSEMR